MLAFAGGEAFRATNLVLRHPHDFAGSSCWPLQSEPDAARGLAGLGLRNWRPQDEGGTVQRKHPTTPERPQLQARWSFVLISPTYGLAPV